MDRSASTPLTGLSSKTGETGAIMPKQRIVGNKTQKIDRIFRDLSALFYEMSFPHDELEVLTKQKVHNSSRIDNLEKRVHKLENKGKDE